MVVGYCDGVVCCCSMVAFLTSFDSKPSPIFSTDAGVACYTYSLTASIGLSTSATGDSTSLTLLANDD